MHHIRTSSERQENKLAKFTNPVLYVFKFKQNNAHKL